MFERFNDSTRIKPVLLWAFRLTVVKLVIKQVCSELPYQRQVLLLFFLPSLLPELPPELPPELLRFESEDSPLRSLLSRLLLELF